MRMKMLLSYATHFCAGTLLLLAESGIAASTNTPHNHGVMDVVVYKTPTTFELEIIVPAHQITGFETAPELSEQKLKLRDARMRLNTAEQLFTFGKGPTCNINSELIDVSADMIFYHQHEKPSTGSTFFSDLFAKKQAEKKVATDIHSVGENGHSDFKLFYQFDCSSFGEVDFTGLFENTIDLDAINFHANSWNGTVYLTLTPDQPHLKMEDFTDATENASSVIPLMTF